MTYWCAPRAPCIGFVAMHGGALWRAADVCLCALMHSGEKATHGQSDGKEPCTRPFECVRGRGEGKDGSDREAQITLKSRFGLKSLVIVGEFQTFSGKS